MKIAMLGLVAGLFSMPAVAQQISDNDRNVFLFGGRMSTGHMHEMLNPFGVAYENTVILGGGYQQFFAEPLPDVRVGLEVGGAVRIGMPGTGEMWGGIVGRYDGWSINGLRISSAVTFGVSVVDQTVGIEAERSEWDGYPGDILFYLSPELSFSTATHPETEIFWRIQHRSGAWNSLGGGGSANATTIGIRISF